MSTGDRQSRLAGRFQDHAAPPAPPAAPTSAQAAVPAAGALYRRGSVYLTDQQARWLKSVVRTAAGEDLNLSASDVMRLALDRLREELSWEDMRPALIQRAHADAQQYPGRAKRGLPPLED